MTPEAILAQLEASMKLGAKLESPTMALPCGHEAVAPIARAALIISPVKCPKCAERWRVSTKAGEVVNIIRDVAAKRK